MKTTTRTTKGVVIAITALALASASFAQQADRPSVAGTYYSAKDFEWKPPLPFNPHPDLPAIEFGPGKFLVDDTGVPHTPEQAEARKRWQEADALAKAIAADPVLAAAARQAAEEAARKREADWQARLQAAQPFLRSWGLPRRCGDTASARGGPSGVAGVGAQGRGSPCRCAAH